MKSSLRQEEFGREGSLGTDWELVGAREGSRAGGPHRAASYTKTPALLSVAILGNRARHGAPRVLAAAAQTLRGSQLYFSTQTSTLDVRRVRGVPKVPSQHCSTPWGKGSPCHTFLANGPLGEGLGVNRLRQQREAVLRWGASGCRAPFIQSQGFWE